MKQFAYLRAISAWVFVMCAMTLLRVALHILPDDDPTRLVWLPLASLAPFHWRALGQVVTATVQATPADSAALLRDAPPAPAEAA